MSRYHTRLKNEIRQIQLDTIALKRINKEMQKELNGDLEAEYIQDTVDAHIEAVAESRDGRN
tara:strand:+ start:81 stop:266 length:186 start_codon:yes stop_codon:yes gene_type:complete